MSQELRSLNEWDGMETRPLKIAPQYRRSCWYIIASLPIVVAGMIWLPNKQVPLAEVVIGGSVLCLLVLPLVVAPLMWRLWLGEHGLHRRFLGYETVWDWKDFAEGRIEERPELSILHIDKPWWSPWRRISLGVLSPHDLNVVNKRIESYFSVSDPNSDRELPDQLALRLGWERLRIDNKGLSTSETSYLWSEITEVDVRRSSSRRADFTSLEIVLPDRVIRVNNIRGQTAGWKWNPKPEIFAKFIRQQMPANRYQVSLPGEPLANRAMAERRCAEARKEAKAFWYLCLVQLFAILSSALLWNLGFLVCLVLWIASFWVAYRLERYARTCERLVVNDAWKVTPWPTCRL